MKTRLHGEGVLYSKPLMMKKNFFLSFKNFLSFFFFFFLKKIKHFSHSKLKTQVNFEELE
jgi:hypothetical protein